MYAIKACSAVGRPRRELRIFIVPVSWSVRC